MFILPIVPLLISETTLLSVDYLTGSKNGVDGTMFILLILFVCAYYPFKTLYTR